MNFYPALFLLANSAHAQWYQIDSDNKLELLKETKAEYYKLSDHEGSFQSQGKVGAPDIMSKIKLAEEKKFLGQVANQTKDILHGEQKTQFIVYSSPQPIKNELYSLLKDACGSHTYKYVAGNHVGESKEKIMELFKGSLKVYEE